MSWSDEELILLGHLVGDGSYLTHQPLRYTTASEENSAAVRAAAEALGSTVTRHAGRGLWHQLVIAGNGNRWHAKGVGAWLKNLGIFNQRSHEKRIPAEVFALPNDQIALLLRHLWATDGCIYRPRLEPRQRPRLLRHVQQRIWRSTLLRFSRGSASLRACDRPFMNGGRPVHQVDVSGAEQQRLFISEVGVFGPRVPMAERLVVRLEDVIGNTNVDTLPVECLDRVSGRMQALGISQAANGSVKRVAQWRLVAI